MIENLCAVIPYRDNRVGLERLIGSLPAWLPFVVVDDCSEIAPPTQLIKAHGGRLVTMAARGYFSGAVNAGLVSTDRDVLVLNQDVTLASGDWWAALNALRQQHAIIGDGVMKHPAWPKGYVQGTFMFLRRDAIDAVGLLDEAHWPLWGATAEWQLRACRRGFSAYPMGNCPWFTHGRKGNFGSSIQRLLQQEPDKRDLYIRTPPLVSVVTACYNYGRYLPDLVASLIGGDSCLGPQPGQTFQGFEVVICDDRSTDNSWEIAQGLADDWKAIRAVRRDANGGTAAALNTAIAAAHGRYIMTIDADDMLEPDALERFLSTLEQDPHRLIYSDMTLFAGNARGAYWKMQDYNFETLLNRNHVPSGTMFTKAAWKEVGGYPPAFARGRQDWAWAVRMGEHGYCGVRVPQPLYLYRRERQNRSITNATGEWRRRFVGMMHETFPHLYQGERPMGCCGGRTKVAVTSTKRSVAASEPLPGSSGMVLLEYASDSSGKTSFWGPVTRTRYVFGGSSTLGYVDAKDAPGMLELREGRRALFRVRTPTPKVAPETTVAPETLVVEEEVGVFQELVAEEERIAEVSEPAPSEVVEAALEVRHMTIAALRTAVKDADAATIDQWAEQEKAGKNRPVALHVLKTAKLALEEAAG